MSRHSHSLEQEQLMAYLDGELARDAAVEAAAHLERCPECQAFAAELKTISRELTQWEIEPLDSHQIPATIAATLEKPRKQTKRRGRRLWGVLITPRRISWAGGIAVMFLLVIALSVPNLMRNKFAAEKAQGLAAIAPPTQPTSAPNLAGYISSHSAATGGNQGGRSRSSSDVNLYLSEMKTGADASEDEKTAGENRDEASRSGLNLPHAPMIARTASLALVAHDFEKTRNALAEILKQHSGYIGELSVNAPAGAGRTLTATLRVPAQQLDSALAEIKTLGRVETESQGGEEVTQQYVDLAARLANAQHTEQRLTNILRQRTGKLEDVLKVELEIDRVRGEIEQMQAEKKELSKRVAFATLNTTIKEEYKATLEGAPPSTSSRFHNAAVEGYNTLIEGLIGIGLFLLSSGPTLLVWAAVLFFPVRWLWRKLRAEMKKDREQEAS